MIRVDMEVYHVSIARVCEVDPQWKTHVVFVTEMALLVLILDVDLGILLRPDVTISVARQWKISAADVDNLVRPDVTISAARQWKISAADVGNLVRPSILDVKENHRVLQGVRTQLHGQPIVIPFAAIIFCHRHVLHWTTTAVSWKWRSHARAAEKETAALMVMKKMWYQKISD